MNILKNHWTVCQKGKFIAYELYINKTVIFKYDIVRTENYNNQQVIGRA